MQGIFCQPAPRVKPPQAPKPQHRKKRTRLLDIVRDPFSDSANGLIRMTIEGQATLYRTTKFQCDPIFGVFAFRFAKINPDHSPTGEVYDLSVSTTEPKKALINCDCIGYTRWCRCKHSDALRVLLSRREV